jgi:hypothetical protein
VASPALCDIENEKIKAGKQLGRRPRLFFSPDKTFFPISSLEIRFFRRYTPLDAGEEKQEETDRVNKLSQKLRLKKSGTHDLQPSAGVGRMSCPKAGCGDNRTSGSTSGMWKRGMGERM